MAASGAQTWILDTHESSSYILSLWIFSSAQKQCLPGIARNPLGSRRPAAPPPPVSEHYLIWTVLLDTIQTATLIIPKNTTLVVKRGIHFSQNPSSSILSYPLIYYSTNCCFVFANCLLPCWVLTSGFFTFLVIYKNFN